MYDVETSLGTAIFSYDSERSFNGDGYSFTVYELPVSIRERFESVDARLLSDFPKRPSFRDHWSVAPWQEAPHSDSFEESLEFALSSYDRGNQSELELHFDAILSALSHTRTYYAYFYYNPSNYLGNIDLFIVDLNGNRLYVMNHNN